MNHSTPNNEEEETETIESYKDSLLDALRTSYDVNKELRCTRVLYIGHMTSSKQKDIIKNIHSKFIESQKSTQEITGALLFINNLFYHMIEIHSLESLHPLFEEMIYEETNNFFQHIDPLINNTNKINPELLNLNVKICCVSEEITREFPIWSVREVNLPGGANNDDTDKNKGNKDNATEEEDDQEVEDGEALQNVLFDTMKGMIEIGRQLCMKQDKDAAMKLFQSSQREIMNRFPTPDKIEFFNGSKLL
eukprot:UN09180